MICYEWGYIKSQPSQGSSEKFHIRSYTRGPVTVKSDPFSKLMCECYTAKNAQVVTCTSLLTSCNNLLEQVGIRMRSHSLQQLVTTSLLQVVYVFYYDYGKACHFLVMFGSLPQM